MAHFAELNSAGVVLRVVVISNDELLDDGVECESKGVARCQKLFGTDTIWKQTSYNANMRKNYAGIGYTYNAARDAFIAPQPYKSWVLDEATCQWQAPKQMPNDGRPYTWNEGLLRWIALA